MENIDSTEVNNHLTQAGSVGNVEVNNSNYMKPAMQDYYKALLRCRDLEIASLKKQMSDLHFRKMANSNYKSQKNSKNIEQELNDTHKYKMKLDKFQGKDDEDFDLWWEDLRTFLRFQNIVYPELYLIKPLNMLFSCKRKQKLNQMRIKANVPSRIQIEQMMMIGNNCPTVKKLKQKLKKE